MALLPPVFEDAQQATAELGQAMQHPAFAHIVTLLEGWEIRLLVTGIDDPDQTKDFLRGAVFAARSIRSALLTAKEYIDSQTRQKDAKEPRRVREFFAPGSGAGDLS
jgi:hypothetical protein